jgi:hypothetical protein
VTTTVTAGSAAGSLVPRGRQHIVTDGTAVQQLAVLASIEKGKIEDNSVDDCFENLNKKSF